MLEPADERGGSLGVARRVARQQGLVGRFPDRPAGRRGSTTSTCTTTATGRTIPADYGIAYSDSFTVTRLDPGEHTIEAVLANADHSLTDVSTEITVTVSDRGAPAERRPPRRRPVRTATEPGAARGYVVRYRRAARWFHTAVYLVTFVLVGTGWWLWNGRRVTPASSPGRPAWPTSSSTGGRGGCSSGWRRSG